MKVRLHWARNAREHSPDGRWIAHVLDRYDLGSGLMLAHCGLPIVDRVTLVAPPESWPPTTIKCQMCLHEIERRLNAAAYEAQKQELDLLYPDLVDPSDEPGFC